MRGTRLVLRRELEPLVRPGDDDVQALVPGRQGDDSVQRTGAPVLLVPARRDVGVAGVVIVRVDVEVPAPRRQRGRPGHLRQGDADRVGDPVATAATFARRQVDPHDVGRAQVVDIGVHAGDDEVAGEDCPVVPLLRAAPHTPQVRRVQGHPGPADRGRVQQLPAFVRQRDGRFDLAFLGGHRLNLGTGGAPQ